MENKNKFWKGVLVGTLVTAFAGLIIIGMAAGIWVVGNGVIQNQSAQITGGEASPSELSLDIDRIGRKIELMQQITNEEYLFEEDTEQVESGIYMGMMAGLGDPYSVYYTEEDFTELMENSIEGEYCGIGAMISQNRETMMMTVIRVFENTPSAEAGMLPGDVIVAVDGQDVSGMELDLVVGSYIKGEERSFTIIAYPVKEIGENFEEIFRETVKINTLDNQLYQQIQQNIIEALDKGEYVRIKGREGNETDLRVHLHHLADPKKQTNFENCVADVNIPVGEVFTSPVLQGTDGVLFVSKVFLNGLEYKDLKICFQDGKIAEYSCRNFQDEEENRKLIKENILYHHDTLPLGEFAIGTNTTAYVMAQKYQIGHLLPILIAEKMGPHFAVGDTCYSWCEDTPVYNPDGREIIARDNEVSIQRKQDISKAYLGCHTDITIPYDELDSICVEALDGSEIYIIREGRFVLPGTETLNEAFTS